MESCVTRIEADQLIFKLINSRDLRRATFAGECRGPDHSDWVRIIVRPILLRDTHAIQFSFFDGKKTDVQNLSADDMPPAVAKILSCGFSGIHIDTDSESIDIRTTKKGAVSVSRKKVNRDQAVDRSHNRTKQVALDPADRLYHVMGIATADGTIKPTMRAKYVQVNEFLKHLSHAIKDAKLESLGRPVEILDCGCGSSYLTLAAHHYLNHVLHIPARILGVDVNDALIKASTEKAAHLSVEGIAFSQGRIGKLSEKPDIVLALHACDTATDDAIIQAVRSHATLFLGVPCCHRHLNRQLKRDGVLSPILRHGILRERQADLLTDSLRALALRIAGYKTDVVEFVTPEHTAKNLMIRAVRGGPINDVQSKNEFEELKSFWNVLPYIEKVFEVMAVDFTE